MTQNWSFAIITDILLKKIRSVMVSQNDYLNKILDVHPLRPSNQYIYLKISYAKAGYLIKMITCAEVTKLNLILASPKILPKEGERAASTNY